LAVGVGAARLLQHLEDSIKSGQTLVSTKGFASCRFTNKIHYHTSFYYSLPGGRSPFAIFCLLERLCHKNVRTLSEMVAAESVGAVRLLQHLEDSIKSGQTLVSTRVWPPAFLRIKSIIIIILLFFARWALAICHLLSTRAPVA
jgi:hypothetical protein